MERAESHLYIASALRAESQIPGGFREGRFGKLAAYAAHMILTGPIASFMLVNLPVFAIA